MKEYNIKLTSLDDVKGLVDASVSAPYEIDLSQGRYIINGKSQLGVLSLDLSSSIKLIIHCDNDEDILPFVKKIDKIILR